MGTEVRAKASAKAGINKGSAKGAVSEWVLLCACQGDSRLFIKASVNDKATTTRVCVWQGGTMLSLPPR